MHNFNVDTLTIINVKIFNQSQGNNDGINVDGCRNVYIVNCLVDSFNDCIVLKTTSPIATENVIAENCTLSSYARVIKIGTETTGGFSNITIKNMHIKKSSFAFSQNASAGISLSIVDGGYIDGVIIDSIEMLSGVETPIFIRLGNRARPYTTNIPTPPMGYMKNILLQNITAKSNSNITSMINGIPNHYAENITLRNINLNIPGGLDSFPSNFTLPEQETEKPETDIFGDSIPAKGFYARHVKNLVLDNVCFSTVSNDGRDWLYYDDVINSSTPEITFNATDYCTENLPNSISTKTQLSTLIYPNPANNAINIVAENIDDVIIYDQVGKIVDAYYNINTNQFSWQNVNDLKGLFTIYIAAEKGNSISRVIID